MPLATVGSLQTVRRVGHELTLLREGITESFKESIECARESPEFIPWILHQEPLVKVLCASSAGMLRHWTTGAKVLPARSHPPMSASARVLPILKCRHPKAGLVNSLVVSYIWRVCQLRLCGGFSHRTSTFQNFC